MNTDKTEPITEEVARAIDACESVAKVAEALGVSRPTVYFYRNGKRRIGSEYGALLEQLSGFKVTRQQMWPHTWRRIWPELAGYEHAAPPAVHERYPAENTQIAA